MVALFFLLGSLVSFIFFGVIASDAQTGDVLTSLTAATVVLSGSIWGSAAWIVQTIKNINSSNKKTEQKSKA